MTSLLPLVACVVAALAGIYAVAAHGYLTVIVLCLAYATAAVVAARTPVGATLPGRIALGVVLVVAPLVYAVAVALIDGGRAMGLGIGGALLLCAMPLLLLVPADFTPRPVTAYAPAVAAVCAALLAAASLVVDGRDPVMLAVGGSYLLLAALSTAASGAAGPTRFAMGVLWSVMAAVGVYFLAVSAAGVLGLLLGGLVIAACVSAIGPLSKVRSAESSDADGRVR